MDGTAHWFRDEFEEAIERVRIGFGAVEKLLSDEDVPPVRIRDALANMAYDLKYLLALLHFEKSHYDSLVLEGRLVGTLAWLEGHPIAFPAWRKAFLSLKPGLQSIAANPPRFEQTLDQTGLESPRDMFVTGPDRVTEGGIEIDFDIPEASVADQIRNEIANLANRIRDHLPQAS